ncbi:MAG: hypothetical protein OQJ80_04220, partial [Kangiella sp.]|nr:hypothetical protein [Kangiella sp.]
TRCGDMHVFANNASLLSLIPDQKLLHAFLALPPSLAVVADRQPCLTRLEGIPLGIIKNCS